MKALSDNAISRLAHFLVIGDFFVIDKLKKELKMSCDFSLMDMANVPSRNFRFGVTDPAFGKAAMQYIDKALSIIELGEADALVTAPINKSSIRKAGFDGFEGHTEYLAFKTGTNDYAMMFVGRELKVSLVTRHMALKDVSGSLSINSICKTIRLTHDSLRSLFGISKPRIAVAGLNPHAGDNGLFGDEESRIIEPAIKLISREISNVCGPKSADAVFYETMNAKYDAVVAMYHDQALAPFKTLYFNDGVNLTLGLPFVRTSPDHGTAFDISGKGLANATSMKEAIKLACRLSESSHAHPKSTQRSTLKI